MNQFEDIKIPQENLNDEFVKIVDFFCADESPVKTDDKLLAIETSKATVNLYAVTSGFVKYLCREGEEVKVGATIAKIYKDLAALRNDSGKSSLNVLPAARSQLSAKFSKAALNFISKYAINELVFEHKDFVTLDDVRAYWNKSRDIPVDRAQDDLGSANSAVNGVEYKEIPPSKRKEIEILSDVQQSGLTSTVSVLVDTFSIGERMKSLRIFKDSLLPWIICEIYDLIAQYPEFNAFYQDQRVGYYKAIHLGLAVNINDGLKLLRLPDLSKQQIKNVEEAVFSLINKYLDKALSLENLSQTTFTLTDLSSSGVDFFIPLVAQRQSAILGIGKVDRLTQQCRLTLCFDHRVADGKAAADFLSDLKARIEKAVPQRAHEARSVLAQGFLARSAKKQNAPSPMCFRCFKTLSEDQEHQGVGFLKVLAHDGQERWICITCLQGY